MADLIELDLVVRDKGLKQSVSTVERLERQLIKAAKAVEQNRISQDRYNKILLQSKREYQALGMSSQKATAQVRKFAEAQREAGRAAEYHQQQVGFAGKKVNRMGMQMQQAGYQVGDFAVQLQSGTNAAVALGQQGAQLLGIFGPAGAIAGAALAITTAFIAPLLSARKAASSFKDELKEVNNELDLLRSGADNSGVLEINRQIATLVGEIADLKDPVKQFGEGWDEFMNPDQRASILRALEFEVLAEGSILNEKTKQLENLRLQKQALEIIKGLMGDQVSEAENLREVERYNNQQRIAEQKELYKVSQKEASRRSKIRESDNASYTKNTLNEITKAHAAYVKETERVEDELRDRRRDAGIAYFKNEQANETAIHNQRIKNIIAELKAKTEAEAVAVSVRKAAGEAYFRQEDEIQAQILNATVDKIMEEYEAKVEANQNAADLRRAAGEAYFRDQQELEASIHQVRVDNILNEAALREATIDAARAKFNANAGSIAVGEGAAEATAAYNLKKRVEELQKAWRDLGKETKKSTKAVKDNRTAYEKAMMTAEEFADVLDQQVIRAVDGVSNAFSDFLQRGMRDFKGFVKSIGDMFLKLLADMAAAALKRQILIPIATGMAAGFGSAAAGASMGQYATGGAQAGTIGATLAAGASTIGTGLSTGFMTTMYGGGTGAISGGLSIGGLSGFSTAIGAAIPYLIAAAVVIGLFTKKTKLLDSGLRTTVEGFDVAIETFKKTQTSRLFGLLKGSKKTSYEAASAEVADPLIEAIGNMQQSIVDAAGTLGIGANAFDDFSYQFKLSLKGLTEEEQLKKINEEITKMGDSFASLTGHFETMNELLEAANQRMQLQNRLDQLLGNNQAILARQREAELSAMHELNRPLAQMIYNLEDAQASVQSAFASLGASIEAEKNRLRDAFTSIVDGLNKRLDVANETMARSNSIYSMLESAVSGRSITSGIGQSLSRREGALGFIRGGDFSDERKLEEALDVVAEPSEDLFSSFVDYARDFSRTSTTLEEAKKVAQVQLTADEKSVLLLEEQIAQAQVDLDAQLEALDKQYQMQVDQYNALLGIDTSVKSVTEAIGTLKSAIDGLVSAQAAAKAAAAAVGTAGAGAGAAAAGIKLTGEKYQGYDLGNIRGAADLMAAAAQNNIQTSGQTGAQIQQAISNATGLAINMDNATRGKQFAMGGYHTGGLRMVGERGPELEATGPSRIFSHNQTSGMFRDPDLKEAVNELRREVSGLRSEQRQMQASNAKYVKRNYDINRKWDVDGLPATRT